MVTRSMRRTGGRPRQAPGGLDDLRVDDDAALMPRTGLRRQRSHPRPAVLGAIAVCLAGGACLLLPPVPGQPHADAGPAFLATRESPATWLPISHPLQLYAIADPSLSRVPPDYDARRTADGSLRLDRLTYGAFGEPAPFLSLAIRRAGAREIRAVDGAGETRQPLPAGDAGPAPAETDMLVDLVRIAATGGLAVTHAGRADDMPTRFGPVAVVPLTLRRAAVARPCLGFRLARAAPVSIAGLACGGAAWPPDRAALACMLDGIDIAGGGDDGAVRGFFAAAGPRRDRDCAPLLPVRSASR